MRRRETMSCPNAGPQLQQKSNQINKIKINLNGAVHMSIIGCGHHLLNGAQRVKTQSVRSNPHVGQGKSKWNGLVR